MKRTIFLIATILTLALSVFAQDGPPLEIKEADGSPRIIRPLRIIFPNGTLTQTGRQISFLDSLVPITGTGASGRIAFWTGTSTQSSNAGFLWDNTNLKMTITQGTITTSQPFLNHTSTWNAGGVTFSNLVSNVTDTASAAGSLLFDFQVGGASKGSLRKDGLFTTAGGHTLAGQITDTQGTLTGASAPFITHTATWNDAGVTFTNLLSNVTDTASNAASLLFDFQVGASSKVKADKTGLVTLVGVTSTRPITLTQGTITASNPIINHTATFNDGAVSFTDDLRNITNTASLASSKFLDYQIGGTTKFAVDIAGSLQGSNTKALTAASATNVIQVDVASGSFAGGFLDYTVFASDATDHQARTGRVGLQLINKAGTETCVVAGPGGNANPAETQDGSSIAASASTLTYTWGTATTPTNGCLLQLTAASGLTETTLQITYKFTVTSGTATVTTQ